MIHLALQTEYTFQKCYGHLEQIVQLAKDRGHWALGIADKNNSFGHIKFNKLCKSAGIKPIFGVRLDATDITIKARSKYKTYNSILELVFIAKNQDGLKKLYRLINVAYDQYYYFPRLTYEQVSKVSNDIIVIAPYLPSKGAILASRIDFKGVSPATLGYPTGSAYESLRSPEVSLIKNEYMNIEDRGVYELLSSPRNTDLHIYPQHILTEGELIAEGISKEAINKTESIAMECNVELNFSEMVKYKGNKTLYGECMNGFKQRKIDPNDPIYSERLKSELSLIAKKNFGDYFLIVSDMIKEAKKMMLVGPARGSSAGSLVCYLMGITEVDPIKHGLLFERFIDENRLDFPDIDTDFADHKRPDVIKYLTRKYGKNNVKSIGTVSKLKSKSAIGEFAKGLDIPPYETEDLKNAIIERNKGDARATMCILDTLEGTEIGKNFIKMYPEMKIVAKIEDHARHAGKHAAGVIVSNYPLSTFGGIDSRENIIQMDGKDAESIGLLKIDCLGLRTLSILEETAKLVGFNHYDFYDLPLDDEKTYELFKSERFSAIFQFEGTALQIVAKQMGVKKFSDIVAITALARPGALNSGGTEKFIDRHIGKKESVYYGELHKKITKDTHGVVIFQEQMMNMARIIGKLSWRDVQALRRASSKSMGDEFFGKYEEKFILGTKEHGYNEDEAKELWRQISSAGSWIFNKSHAVSYALISYFTAYCKAHFPLEFAAANLIHSKKETQVKILRDFVINDKIKYKAVDPDLSDVNWTIKNGTLLGGLINIDGIGEKKAMEIIKKREQNGRFTPAIFKKLINPKTDFDILFPTYHYFGQLYDNPSDFKLPQPPTKIADILGIGKYTLIGIVRKIDLRDRNDFQSVFKRGYEVEKDRFFLNLYIEDDTDKIKIMIPPFRFDQLKGQFLAETLKEDESYVYVMGEIKDNWRSISVEQIAILNTTIGMERANAKRDIRIGN